MNQCTIGIINQVLEQQRAVNGHLVEAKYFSHSFIQVQPQCKHSLTFRYNTIEKSCCTKPKHFAQKKNISLAHMHKYVFRTNCYVTKHFRLQKRRELCLLSGSRSIPSLLDNNCPLTEGSHSLTVHTALVSEP